LKRALKAEAGTIGLAAGRAIGGRKAFCRCFADTFGSAFSFEVGFCTVEHLLAQPLFCSSIVSMNSAGEVESVRSAAGGNDPDAPSSSEPTGSSALPEGLQRRR